MRVLVVNDHATVGGAAQLFRRTNALLRQAGHHVVEVTGDALDRTLKAQVRNRVGPWRQSVQLWRRELVGNAHQLYYPALFAQLTRVLQDGRIDVAHVHNVHTRLSPQVIPFLRRRGVPVVYQVNDYSFFCNTFWAYNRRLDAPCQRCLRGSPLWALRYGCVSSLGVNRVDRAALQALTRGVLAVQRPWAQADRFLVTSDVASALLTEWGVARERQTKIWNPILEAEVDVPRRLGEEIVFYGTYLPSKGAETFAAALEHVAPGCRLGVYLMAMTPAYAARLRTVAERRGLALTVDSTLRWERGLRERVAEARAVVVPSQWWVTSENVVYEAMWLGKAVILSRMGGNIELVVEGETGLFFEPRDSYGLADAINRLWTDAPVAARMGEAARARARTRYSATRFLTVLEGAYHTAMGRTAYRRSREPVAEAEFVRQQVDAVHQRAKELADHA